MKTAIYLVLVTLFVYSESARLGDEKADCPPNQQYDFCPSPCKPQCNNFRGEKCPIIINYKCVAQCSCKEGYLRITENECIAADLPECGGAFVPKWPEPQEVPVTSSQHNDYSNRPYPTPPPRP